ncbi:MAG: hypothetical protein Phog2KO_44180 [Phototrophicaceae bacterium]
MLFVIQRSFRARIEVLIQSWAFSHRSQRQGQIGVEYDFVYLDDQEHDERNDPFYQRAITKIPRAELRKMH